MPFAWVGAAAGLASVANTVGGMVDGGGNQPAGNTTQTTTQVPWSVQSPYLTQGFQGASDLYKNYKPQYYQGQQVADLSPAQIQAMQGASAYANSGQSPFKSANNYLQGLEGGQYLNSNPASQNLAQMASGQYQLRNPVWNMTNAGMNQSNSVLGNIASNYNTGNTGNNILQGYATGAGRNNPATGALSYLSSGAPAASLPGQNTLSYFANGSMLGADNPYWKNLTDSLSASVLPGIQAQFAKGNNMSNPAAAFASSQGLASALAPYMEQNYTTGQSNMLGAANTLGSQGLQGLQLQQGAAGQLGNQYLQGQQIGSGAAQNLASNQYVGQGQGIQAAQGIGANTLNQGTLFNNAFNSGLQNMTNANSIIGQNYQSTLNNMTNGLSQAPSIGQMPYNELQQLFASGAQGQTQNQNQINALMNQWNWQQQLPYNQLNQFMNTVGGAQYGGQTTQTTPYFQNSYANNAASLAGLGGLADQARSIYYTPGIGLNSTSGATNYSLIQPQGGFQSSTVASSVPSYEGP